MKNPKRTISTYVRMRHDERPGWELEIPFKVLYIDVKKVAEIPTVQEPDEDDPTLDEEDLNYMDEVEEQSMKREVVETMLLLGNHKTGDTDWFHSSEVIFIS